MFDSIPSQNKSKHITFYLSCRLVFNFSTVNVSFLIIKYKCHLSFCFKWLKPGVPVWLPIAGARRTSGGCGCSRAVKLYTRTASQILWYAPTDNWRKCVCYPYNVATKITEQWEVDKLNENLKINLNFGASDMVTTLKTVKRCFNAITLCIINTFWLHCISKFEQI